MTHYDDKLLEAAGEGIIAACDGCPFIHADDYCELDTKNCRTRRAKFALTAYHSQREEAGVVEVPREPTEEMINQGGSAGMQEYLNTGLADCLCEHDDGEIDHDSFVPCALCEKINRAIYQAMIAAAKE